MINSSVSAIERVRQEYIDQMSAMNLHQKNATSNNPTWEKLKAALKNFPISQKPNKTRMKGCRLPELDPWNPELKGYFKAPHIPYEPDSHENKVLYTYQDKLKMNKTALEELGRNARDVLCQYSYVTSKKVLPPIDMEEDSVILSPKYTVIETYCYSTVTGTMTKGKVEADDTEISKEIKVKVLKKYKRLLTPQRKNTKTETSRKSYKATTKTNAMTTAKTMLRANKEEKKKKKAVVKAETNANSNAEAKAQTKTEVKAKAKEKAKSEANADTEAEDEEEEEEEEEEEKEEEKEEKEEEKKKRKKKNENNKKKNKQTKEERRKDRRRIKIRRKDNEENTHHWNNNKDEESNKEKNT